MTLLKDLVSFLFYAIGRPFRKRRPVVLVYHAIDSIPAAADPLKLSVPPPLFLRQMEELARQRLDCTVSFDDGYESVRTHAWPVLQRYGLRSTLFVATDIIDGRLNFDGHFTGIPSPAPLTWGQIQQLAEAGMRLGSHSKTHQRMTSLTEAQMQEEARGSRDRIRQMTGQTVEAFSYPFGDHGSFDEKTEKTLRETGYRKTYTNLMGPDRSASDPWKIRRVRIYPTDTLPRFRMKIAGAYDWVDGLLGLKTKLRATARSRGPGHPT